ncbi:Meiotic central spindle [Carabus blaptoides fortunei]
MNTSVDDWLRPKSTCTSIDCMDPGYLSDVNFLSSKNSELCSSDIGLELILVDDKKESNLSFSGISDKNSDLDCADPMLNAKTKIVIRTNNGHENYEGYTAELTESIGLTSVKTAATIKEEKGQMKVQAEPEDRLVRNMLSVLGISDDMLYTMVTNLGLRLWVCPENDCRRIFNRLNTLKSHILSHYGLKPFKCDFPGCPWSFYTSFKLKRHRETHLKRKDFKCSIPDCNRTFTTIYNLNTHMKLHERPARLKCLVRSCNCKFQTRRAMEIHLKTHESSLAPYKCAHPGCNKLYFSCNALTAHSRSHQHKEEELRCQWDNCGRLFDKPCRLKAHMRQHTGDKPYVCKFKDCKWAFSSSSKLKRHQYKHNNERKFRCTIGDCTKAFMRSEHLREHTYTHIGQRTHQCSVCGEKCPTKTTLDEHKKKFHPNDKSSNRKRKVSVTTESEPTTSASLTCLDQKKAQRIREEENCVTSSKDDSINHEIILSIPDESNVLSTLGANAIIMQDRTTENYDIDMLQIVIPTATTDNKTTVYEIETDGSKEKLKSQKKTKASNKTNVVNKSARTHLPYMVVPMKPDKKHTLVHSDVQESIDNTRDSDEGYNDLGLPYFLEPPELPSNSDALCSVTLQDDAINTDLINPEDAQYILLLDSGTNSNFPESTINLRDLH